MRNPVRNTRPTSLIARIKRCYPHGYFAEESADPDAWPWLTRDDRPRRRRRANAQRSEESADAALHALERDAAEALLNENSNGQLTSVAQRLSVWLNRNVSADGLWLAEPWQTYRLLPPLDRLRIGLSKSHWSKRLEEAFRRVLDTTMRLCGGDGWIADRRATVSTDFHDLFERLAREPGRGMWSNVARWLASCPGDKPRSRPPHPGFSSESSRIAVMRRDWAAGAACLTIDFRGGEIHLSFRIGAATIFDGPWHPHVGASTDNAVGETNWTLTCWYADEDGEYLELSGKLGDATVVDRQIYLARRAHLLWLSDSFFAADSTSVVAGFTLALPTELHLVGDIDVRCLSGGDAANMVRFIPVGLPADLFAPTKGRLTFGASQMGLMQAGRGSRILVPLVVTWGRRLTAQQSWRQLSVTSYRKSVEPDQAVAFRLPLPECQFVFFRALLAATKHVFLGYETHKECVIGEFGADANVHDWVTVDSCDDAR